MDSRGRQARDRDRICVMLERMPRISPTLEGFRAVFRRPSFTLAEITWRWTAGATTVVLLLFGLVEFLGTLPVTDRELLFLRTRHPYLVIQALAHILHGSVSRAVISLMLAVLLLTLVWIVAASFGRYVTVSALLDYFRDAAAGANRGEGDVVGNVSRTAMASREGAPVRVLVRLNFLRAAVTLAALASFAGAAILAGFASADGRPRPGLALLVFLILAALICMAWNSLNWMLSLAGIFAVRDHDDALTAISTAVVFQPRSRRRHLLREHLDRASSPGGIHRRDRSRFHPAGFCCLRAMAAGGRARADFHARLFRDRRLDLHGAPRRVRLHRRDAGRLGDNAPSCFAGCSRHVAPDNDRP